LNIANQKIHQLDEENSSKMDWASDAFEYMNKVKNSECCSGQCYENIAIIRKENSMLNSKLSEYSERTKNNLQKVSELRHQLKISYQNDSNLRRQIQELESNVMQMKLLLKDKRKILHHDDDEFQISKKKRPHENIDISANSQFIVNNSSKYQIPKGDSKLIFFLLIFFTYAETKILIVTDKYYRFNWCNIGIS